MNKIITTPLLNRAGGATGGGPRQHGMKMSTGWDEGAAESAQIEG